MEKSTEYKKALMFSQQRWKRHQNWTGSVTLFMHVVCVCFVFIPFFISYHESLTSMWECLTFPWIIQCFTLIGAFVGGNWEALQSEWDENSLDTSTVSHHSDVKNTKAARFRSNSNNSQPQTWKIRRDYFDEYDVQRDIFLWLSIFKTHIVVKGYWNTFHSQ